MPILIPFISALLFRFGGSDQWEWARPFNQKLWRWLGIGITIGLMTWHGWLTFLLTISAYTLAIQAFPYGDNSWLNFLGQKGKHFVSGFIFGLASFPLVGIACLWQAIISGIVFYLIEKKQVDNPFAEWLRGFGGTIIYPILYLWR